MELSDSWFVIAWIFIGYMWQTMSAASAQKVVFGLFWPMTMLTVLVFFLDLRAFSMGVVFGTMIVTLVVQKIWPTPEPKRG